MYLLIKHFGLLTVEVDRALHGLSTGRPCHIETFGRANSHTHAKLTLNYNGHKDRFASIFRQIRKPYRLLQTAAPKQPLRQPDRGVGLAPAPRNGFTFNSHFGRKKISDTRLVIFAARAKRKNAYIGEGEKLEGF